MAIRADVVPQVFTSEALADALTHEDLRGQRRIAGLERRRGAAYSVLDCGRAAPRLMTWRFYDVATPAVDERALAELKRGVDVVTLTSPSTARGLADIAGDLLDLDSLQTVCIGPVTAEAARTLGFRVVATADTHTIGRIGPGRRDDSSRVSDLPGDPGLESA